LFGPIYSLDQVVQSQLVLVKLFQLLLLSYLLLLVLFISLLLPCFGQVAVLLQLENHLSCLVAQRVLQFGTAEVAEHGMQLHQPLLGQHDLVVDDLHKSARTLLER